MFFRIVPGCRMSVGCKVWGRRVCVSHQLRWLNRCPHVWARLCFQHGDLPQWVRTPTCFLQPATWLRATDRHILRGLSREERCSCKYVACVLLSRCSSSEICCILLTFFYEGPLLERKSRITFRQDQGVQTLLITIGVTGDVYERRIWCCKNFYLHTLGNLQGTVKRKLEPSVRSCHQDTLPDTVAYPGILFVGGSTNSVEDRGQRKRGSGGSSPLVRCSGGSCNLVQEISFHIVKFS